MVVYAASVAACSASSPTGLISRFLVVSLLIVFVFGDFALVFHSVLAMASDGSSNTSFSSSVLSCYERVVVLVSLTTISIFRYHIPALFGFA